MSKLQPISAARTEIRKESFKRKNNFTRNVIRSPLPGNLTKLLLRLAEYLSGYCDNQIAWPSEAKLAKDLQLSLSTIKRLLRKLAAIKCFEIIPLPAQALIAYAEKRYGGYRPPVGRATNWLNTYRPVWDHVLWSSSKATEQDYLGIMQALEDNHPARVESPQSRALLNACDTLTAETTDQVTDSTTDPVTGGPQGFTTKAEDRQQDWRPSAQPDEIPSLKGAGEGASPGDTGLTANPSTPEEDDPDTTALMEEVASHACLEPSRGEFTHGRQSFYRWAIPRFLDLLAQLPATDQEAILARPVIIAQALRGPRWNGLVLSWGLLLSRFPDRLLGSIKKAVAESRRLQQRTQPIPAPPPPLSPPSTPRTTRIPVLATSTEESAAWKARRAELRAKLRVQSAS